MLLPDAQIQTLLTQSGKIDEKTLSELLTFVANARIPLQEAVIEKDAQSRVTVTATTTDNGARITITR